MKIQRLDLIAFGPFTDVVLDLSEGHEGLHLICGPNEAGKSSTLRGLRQMLYGIDAQTTDGFLHPYANLRIGASLRHSDGTVLEFIRRKGNKNTLLDADGRTPLGEGELTRFLGGASPEVFENLFGIDHVALGRGGREIIEGRGELGQVLFLAGSGISDLRSVQAGLEDEIGKLFKPAGRVPKINQALADLRDVRSTLKQQQLSCDVWARHKQSLQQARQCKSEIEDRLQDLQRQKGRLERIKRALTGISKLKQLREERAGLADARMLSPDFTKTRSEAETGLQVALSQEQQATAKLAELEAELESVEIPEQFLQRAETVDELYRRLGSHQKAMRDRADRARERQQFEEDARAMLRGLRPDLSLENIEQLRVTGQQRRRIRELGNRQQALVADGQAKNEAAAKIRMRIDEFTQRLERLPVPPDPAELRETLHRLRQHGALEEQRDAAAAALEKGRRDAAIELSKLPLWQGTLEELEKLPIPPADTVERFQRETSEVEKRIDQLEARIEEEERELGDLNGQIDRIRREHEVPTEEDLQDRRQSREAGWQLIRRAWQQGGGDIEDDDAVRRFIEAHAPAADLAAAYEHSVVQADEIADRLRREADQVAHKAKLLADREKRSEHLQRLTAQRAETLAERDRVNEAWSSVWKPLSLQPFPPQEMRAWMQRQTALTVRAAELRERQDALSGLTGRVAAARTELLARLDELAPPVADAASIRDRTHKPLVQLLDEGQALASQWEEQQRQRDDLEADIAEARRELPAAQSAATKAQQELDAWRATWRAEMERLGLSPAENPTEANAFLDDVDELFKRVADIAKHEQRIADIDADAAQFASDVQAFADSAAPDLAGLPVDQAAAALKARLEEAREEQSRRQALSKQRDKERQALDAARETIAQARAQLDALCGEAGCDRYEELPAAEERWQRRQRIEQDAASQEEQLQQDSGGAALDEFLAEAAREDPDSLPFAIEQLTEQIADLSAQRDQVRDTIVQEQIALESMDGSAEAAQSREREQSLLAEMESDVEQYVRFKLASVLLREGIARYREKNQNPVLQRAGRFFAGLTLEAFSELRVDYENDQAILVGVRSGSQSLVKLEEMSDGTCDQLYLALRLAGIAHHLEKRHEPMPFIVDDVLVNFDNDRAAAALKALAELSRQTQVIFFTHHEHLIELAEAHLESAEFIVHNLAHPASRLNGIPAK